ncbi:MAG TPA: heavy metal-binding domain-containing protein [Planctomycetes bacterium]|nr:heavy metal-binding domain-containing protein [Planctomycetota bacterium]
MIVVTSDTIPGRTIEATIGLVKGNSVRARHLGRDITAAFKNVLGGELDEYTKLLAESREQALDRMIAEAEALGANAICGMRFSSSEIVQGAAELLAYGTAVRLAD